MLVCSPFSPLSWVTWRLAASLLNSSVRAEGHHQNHSEVLRLGRPGIHEGNHLDSNPASPRMHEFIYWRNRISENEITTLTIQVKWTIKDARIYTYFFRTGHCCETDVIFLNHRWIQTVEVQKNNDIVIKTSLGLQDKTSSISWLSSSFHIVTFICKGVIVTAK